MFVVVENVFKKFITVSIKLFTVTKIQITVCHISKIHVAYEFKIIYSTTQHEVGM